MKHKTKKYLIVPIIGILTAGLLAGCGGAKTTPTEKESKQAVISQQAEVVGQETKDLTTEFDLEHFPTDADAKTQKAWAGEAIRQTLISYMAEKEQITDCVIHANITDVKTDLTMDNALENACGKITICFADDEVSDGRLDDITNRLYGWLLAIYPDTVSDYTLCTMPKDVLQDIEEKYHNVDDHHITYKTEMWLREDNKGNVKYIGR